MENLAPQPARIQKYYTSQLAKLYQVDQDTMYRRLRKLVPVLGEKHKGKPWFAKEVRYIFYKLGTPLSRPLSRPGRKMAEK